MGASRIRGITAVLALALGGSQSLLAQKTEEAPPKVVVQVTENVTTKAVAEEPKAKGQQEGIKVHGHWTIEIKNPDGTVAQHREFENNLISSAYPALVSFLTGFATPGWFAVLITGSPQPCVAPASGPAPGPSACFLVRDPAEAALFPAGIAVPTLTVLPMPLGASPTSIQLQGTAVAAEGSTLEGVGTNLTYCASSSVSLNLPANLSTITPAGCNKQTVGGFQVNFTGTSIPPPAIVVVPTQTIQVTVVLSFS